MILALSAAFYANGNEGNTCGNLDQVSQMESDWLAAKTRILRLPRPLFRKDAAWLGESDRTSLPQMARKVSSLSICKCPRKAWHRRLTRLQHDRNPTFLRPSDFATTNGARALATKSTSKISRESCWTLRSEVFRPRWKFSRPHG